MTVTTPNPPSTSKARKPRLLMVAFACHPLHSMETRIGWRRALLAAESCDTTVLVGPGLSGAELEKLAAEERGLSDSLRFVRIDHDRLSGWLCSHAWTYYLGYRRWSGLAYRAAKRMHAERPFDLTHQVTFCGYREPGYAWRLDAPFVWGPVGGTQDFPRRFLSLVSPADGARELFRSALNWWQLRLSRRVRGAARRAVAITTATTTGRHHLHKSLGVDARVELETGLDCPLGPPRERRDPSQPLRVLWAGRLRAWKAFPLLVRALEQLPEETQVKVRVLGQGPCLRPWRRLADRAGVGHMINWVGWSDYDSNLRHYQWADVFAFTSLRDTSGTGLLESLAMGAPIIGVDHQGAADIMTPECAIPVPVSNPQETSRAMADAIARLAADPDELLRLSRGAQLRAADYCWAPRIETTRELYHRVLRGRPATTEAPASRVVSKPALAEASAIATTTTVRTTTA